MSGYTKEEVAARVHTLKKHGKWFYGENTEMLEALSAELATLRAENERLRKALEGIVTIFEYDPKYGPRPDVVALRIRRGRAALNHTDA